MQGEPFFIRFGEVHLVEVRQVEFTSRDILGAKERALVFADAIRLGDLLPLLHGKERIEPLDWPVRRKITELS